MNADTNNGGHGYTLGDIIEVRVQFEEIDIDGVASIIEPTTVACTFTERTGSPTTYTYGVSSSANATMLTNADNEAVYLFRFTPTMNGRVTYRVAATGTGASATTIECHVRT